MSCRWGRNSSPLRLADSAGGESLNALVSARVNGDGTIELAAGGKLAVAGAARPFGTRVRLVSGKAAQLLTLGEGARRARLWVRATLLPEGQ